MVTSVVFRLQKRGEVVSGYGDLNRVMKELGEPSLQNAREAVIQIRKSKLPDPKILGNAGSFFRNPVLSAREAASLADFLPITALSHLRERGESSRRIFDRSCRLERQAPGACVCTRLAGIGACKFGGQQALKSWSSRWQFSRMY